MTIGKNESIHVKLNKIEKDIIRKKAKYKNMTISDFIRYKALYEPFQENMKK